MSIHVTVSGNPVNIRRGRMILSDLDQIKKNERDRRRRLRLEQVRQQSKEISHRLLERAKRIAREELSKLEKDGKSELKQMHDRKIMELQQKYQEDLEDIGQAHALAALQPDADAIIKEERKKDRAMALKRGKEAVERMKEAKQDSAEAMHQERLRKVREVENTRAAMVAKLPKPTSPEKTSRTETTSSQKDTYEESAHKTLTPTKKSKKISEKRSPRKTKKPNSKEIQKVLSPRPGPSGLQKQSVRQSHKTPSKKKVEKADRIERIAVDVMDDQIPRRTVPTMSTTPTKTHKVARYNPEDYTQDTSDSTSSISSSSSSSVSDDSSYFSDNTEQITCSRTPRAVPLTESKVRLYDYTSRQRNVYNRPLGIVEKIDIRNEPNAIEAAQAMKNAENVKMHTCKTHKINAQRRGEDAILREKVRRDYQALVRNLDHLAQEERKLKASQIQSNIEEDPHVRLHQRDKCQLEHQRKLTRATKKVLTTDDIPDQYCHLTERVVTLQTQKKDDVPHSKWHESQPVEDETDIYQDKDSEMSREEQILDMLKKVERQKRLLLQEFGSSLPDDIFNVSIRPLLDDRVTPRTSQVTDAAMPSTSEIKVINMSSDECVKKDRKGKKPGKSPTKKSEIAVQAALDKVSHAENKAVQVELPEESVKVPHPPSETTRVPHPIEPRITIITPETDDSSNDSTSSEISGMVIEIDKREVIVTPKKRRSSTKVSKRPSPRVYQKIRSTSVSSKATSPIKKFSRSQSTSRLTSPQKKTRCTDMPDTTSRRIDIHVSKSAFCDDETDPSQETKVSIDASAESSQTISNNQDPSSSKPYRVRTQMKRWIRIKDTSDTSTSFASPPPVRPRSVFDALTNVTPILEMLDSSGPEELRRLREEVSPVSTPETPSPRTMTMPSNIPHRERIARMLRYNLIDSQTNDSTVLSSTRIDQTDRSISCQPESAYPLTPLQRPSMPSKACTCKIPTCELLHTKLDDIHDYALKNCPEILQKYEDLQNLCTERIASLTDLIEKVRSEQKGMDLSLISPSDETSLMQLSMTRPARNDVQAVRRLIESIEAVHAQLARTLAESQRIIGGAAAPEDEPSRDAEVQVTTSTPARSKSVDTIDTAHVQKSELVNGKAKPKIISDERVNIQLNRFKIQQKPRAMSVTKTSDRNSWPPCTFPLHEEEVIEKLSKEILGKASTAFATSNGDNEVSVSHNAPAFKDASLRSSSSSEHEKDNSVAREITSIQEARKENGFIPIAGTPKISRDHGTAASISARPKPPVTLLNGPYRPELESSGHELSTIVEFDTTDTVNKNVKSPTKSKPSVHVAPLSVQQYKNSSKKLSDSTSDVKHPSERLSPAQRSQKTRICTSPGKLTNVMDGITSTKAETEQEHTFEKCNKQLQCNTITEDLVAEAKDKLGSSTSTDAANNHKDSKHKTTSTSLYSFSGLSGISEITSSPSSDALKCASSPEEMETALKKLGLGWAVATLKKTREASALSSSSNSDVTPVNTARRMISPTKKHHDPSGLPDISDVSSISIKEASKSTEQAVLLKGRTSTPKFQNSNSSERSSTTNTSESIQDPSDSLTVPNVSLTKTKSDNKQQSP
ncbi:hypothetical protein DMN91_010139 [Ooceraea biroi]|uniref:Uncharacterized protein n=1 Tax=Ooceraea biroi TaxID=2015173 RepID=A0A026WJQ9_OOCBI|nr:uncharacterized protein LOC105278229 [Ooceraea biroi]EZA56282.1 hypothetical protein X777_02901 [Ooceraea biroi]RLU17900.1 hypothetical protein DMN91_010139 [Ooceraea biroi]